MKHCVNYLLLMIKMSMPYQNIKCNMLLGCSCNIYGLIISTSKTELLHQAAPETAKWVKYY